MSTESRKRITVSFSDELREKLRLIEESFIPGTALKGALREELVRENLLRNIVKEWGDKGVDHHIDLDHVVHIDLESVFEDRGREKLPTEEQARLLKNHILEWQGRTALSVGEQNFCSTYVFHPNGRRRRASRCRMLPKDGGWFGMVPAQQSLFAVCMSRARSSAITHSG